MHNKTVKIKTEYLLGVQYSLKIKNTIIITLKSKF